MATEQKRSQHCHRWRACCECAEREGGGAALTFAIMLPTKACRGCRRSRCRPMFPPPPSGCELMTIDRIIHNESWVHGQALLCARLGRIYSPAYVLLKRKIQPITRMSHREMIPVHQTGCTYSAGARQNRTSRQQNFELLAQTQNRASQPGPAQRFCCPHKQWIIGADLR